MTDTCASCFFAQAPPADSGLPNTVLTCNFNAPQPLINPSFWPWPQVNPDFWCGHGSDAATGTSFSSGKNATGPAGPTGPAGAAGPTGPAGSTILFGGSATGGNDGDYYITIGGSTANGIWNKQSGVWVQIVTGFAP